MTSRKNAEKCILCRSPMMRLYLHDSCDDGKRRWLPTGWLCTNQVCGHVSVDELEIAGE